MTQTEPLLQADGISKRFPGVLALDGVSLNIHGGEVHALIGENGAGKSTLMKIFGGVQQPDEGTMCLRGQSYAPAGPAEAQNAGVGLIHQELNLVPDLSVAQNIFLGREPMNSRAFLSEGAMVKRALEALRAIGEEVDPRTLVRELPVATQQMVEIAKAIALDAKILVMDEPTAALADHEVTALFALIRRFLAPDTAVIYISHRMSEIWEVSDRMTIFRDGKFIAENLTSDITRDEAIRLMVGRELAVDARPSAKMPEDRIALEVRGLTNYLLRDVSLRARPGEVLGLAGLVGAGRTELARAIVGADPISAGEIIVNGRTVAIKRPADAVREGIGYLSEDRKRYGLVLDQPISANVVLSSLKDFVSRAGIVRDSKVAKTTDQYINVLQIKTPGPAQLVRFLSGGNQQKVVLAKWLARDCEILIFDEPTRGIDVGTKQEIYALLESLAADGHTIIVISSEMDEVLRLCDRIIVMCNGAITGELSRNEATQESILHLATAFDAASVKETA